MKNLLNILGGLSLLAFSNSIIALECNDSCQLEQVKGYFTALDKVARKGSTTEDIDALLALTHKDVTYVHVEYGASFTKDTWRKAFIRNLEMDRYQNTDKNQIRILKSIAGKNHVAVEYSHGLIQKNGKWEQADKYLAVFGFTDGKLSLIKELW